MCTFEVENLLVLPTTYMYVCRQIQIGMTAIFFYSSNRKNVAVTQYQSGTLNMQRFILFYTVIYLYFFLQLLTLGILVYIYYMYIIICNT